MMECVLPGFLWSLFPDAVQECFIHQAESVVFGSRITLDYLVPKMRSPASPKPGQM